MKKIKLGLLPQILIAIALGIAAGTVSPELPVRVFVTFNALFSQFLNFIIPLIIVGLVTPAIADIGKGAGKMLVATVLLAYGATLFSGFLSFGVGETFFPDLITRNIPLSEISEAKGVTPFFTVAIPEPLNVMTALVMAFTVGLGLAHLDTNYLKNACNDFKEIIVKTIQAVILPLLRNLLQHDSLRTGIPRAGCLCQDYRNHLPSAYFPADIPILHRRNVRRQESVPPVSKNDAGLLYGIRYTVIGRYDSRHPETDYTKRSE